MTTSAGRMRQLVDWSAALWAGFIAGVVFLALNMVLMTQVVGGNVWVIIRYFASLVMGEGVLAPPATFDPLITIVALVVHFVLSIIFGLILAIIIHRWGLLIGIVLGAVFGLALYSINIYALTRFFPWFFVMNHWTFVVAHIIFGAVAGGVYEGLEVERFVPAENAA